MYLYIYVYIYIYIFVMIIVMITLQRVQAIKTDLLVPNLLVPKYMHI